MPKALDKPSFFVINVSNRNVCLSDLAITIPAGKCYDLLNDNFSFSIEQLIASMKTGSIYKKRDKIKVGKGRPQLSEVPVRQLSTYPIITKDRSNVIVTEPQFDELLISDDEYAEQISKEFDE